MVSWLMIFGSRAIFRWTWPSVCTKIVPMSCQPWMDLNPRSRPFHWEGTILESIIHHDYWGNSHLIVINHGFSLKIGLFQFFPEQIME